MIISTPADRRRLARRLNRLDTRVASALTAMKDGAVLHLDGSTWWLSNGRRLDAAAARAVTHMPVSSVSATPCSTGWLPKPTATSTASGFKNPGRGSRPLPEGADLRRIAIVETDHGLPSFPASDKKKDTRYAWFVANYGDRCWELDAMDPRNLRDRVEEAIQDEIEEEAWKRCETVQRAEQESLQTVLDAWGAAP